MKLADTLTVYRKEICEVLRDRRAIFAMILMPALVMPLLILVMGSVSVRTIKKATERPFPVMLLKAEQAPTLRALIEENPRLRLVPEADDYMTQIADKDLRAAVEVPLDFEAALAQGQPREIVISYYQGELKSGLAADELERVFRRLRERTVVARLAERGLKEELIRPFSINQRNVAPPEKVSGNLVGGLIPYLFIIFTCMGAIYPAIELTAGEKERGTLETLLCSPIARLDLVLGKFLAVLTASMGTVVVSVLSFVGTMLIGGLLLFKKEMEETAAGGGITMPTLHWGGVAGVLVMLVPLAVMISALLLAISLFAKTMKEAQAYVTPMPLLCIIPAAMALVPGIELSFRYALVPVLNLALLSKDMVSGVFNWPYIVMIFATTSVYAAVALWACVKMFNRESVIFRT